MKNIRWPSAIFFGILGLAVGAGELTLGSASTSAYVVNGQHWATAATVNESDASWPAVWDATANSAEQAWNGVGTTFTFNNDSSSGNRVSTSNQGNTGTLATSSWSYDGTGTIVQASTVVNTYYQFNPPNPTAPGVSGTFDLQSVLTHEFGHWLSLGHSTSLNNNGSRPVMYYSFAPGEIRTVGSDDASGMRAIYATSILPTSTPTRTPTSAPTQAPTQTPTSSASPLPSATRTPSTTPTGTPPGSPSPIPTPTQSSICALAQQYHFSFPGCPSGASAGASTPPQKLSVVDHAVVAASPSQLSLDPAVSRIVIGTVRDVRPNQQSGGSLFTDAVVDVQEHLLKGQTDSQVIVRSPGGSVTGLTTIVEDSPDLKRGEQVLLFLSQQGNLVPVGGNVFTVRGLEQGIYHLDAGQAISPLPDRTQTLANLRSVIQGSVSRR